MRYLGRLALALLFVLLVASPGLARVAAIQTTAPLPDHSDQAIQAAVKEAVQAAVQVAVAIGLPWVHLREALVFNDKVAVRILATSSSAAEEPDDEEIKPEPGAGLDL